MYDYRKILTAILILTVFCLSSRGQETGRNMYEFSFIKDANPWLTSYNAAGLGTLQVDRTSFIEAFYNKENGGVIPVEGSDDSSLAGIQTESFVRISDRIAFHGMLSYSYFYGKNMGGHYLMDPSYNPVNFVENQTGNTGAKVKELFSLLGGVSYSFNEKWAIGADVEYAAGDYAKRKDPRPMSRWMDMDISAGTKFSPSENFSAGLSLNYARTVEKVECEAFGTTDKQYYTLVDFGGYFGLVENIDNDYGYVGSSGTPMVNIFYGAAAQLVFGRPENIQFFNEFHYSKRSGYYGEKGSSNVTYFEFGGNTLGYDGTLGIRKGSNLHKISIYGEYTGLTNNQNIYRRTTVPGENTVVEYFGQNEALDRTDIDAGLAYAGYMDVGDFRPRWEYGVVLDGTYRSFRATYFPNYRDQNVMTLHGTLYGTRHVTVSRNIFSIGLEAGCFAGSGTKNADGALATSTSDNLRTNDEYLNKDFEYDTAARVSGTLSFRYTRLFKKMSVYLDVRDTYNHTMKKPEFLANGFRNAFTVSVGCSF